MWQNLRRETDPESVHLCDFPSATESLIDQQLSADMEVLFKLVTLGSAARNEAKIKVRQPLAEMRVGPAAEVQAVVDRFGAQILDELNIRRIQVTSDGSGPMRRPRLLLVKKNAAPKLGARLKAVEDELAALAIDRDSLARYRNEGLTVEGRDGAVHLVFHQDFELHFDDPPGWVGATDGSLEVLIDTRITEELKLAGLAREIVRHVQELRKRAGLEMEDRIRLAIRTSSALLQRAVEAHREYIGTETLVGDWTDRLDPAAASATAEIENDRLEISIRKVS
jgi:isoleucyl-tRNA synthetase